MLSLGEIASIFPTAGGVPPDKFSNAVGLFADIHSGQYHWVHCLSPPSYRSTAAWFTGWVSIGGQLVLSASAAFAAGLQLQALITLNNLDTYVPLRWQGMLFYWAILAYSTAVNVWGSKILPHTNLIAGKKPPAVKKLPEIDV